MTLLLELLLRFHQLLLLLLGLLHDLRPGNHLFLHLFELLYQPLLLCLCLLLILLPLLQLFQQLLLLFLLEVLFLYDALFLLFSPHLDLILLTLQSVLNLPHLFFVFDAHNLLDLDDLLAQHAMLLHDL